MKSKYLPKGFTLIELIIVIAILGILAAVVLIALDPLEQFARARDAGRKSSIDQLGHALEAFYTAQNSTFPPEGNLWMTTGTTGNNGLQSSGELKAIPPPVTPACGNATFAQNGYCYETNGTDAIVYVQGESKSEKTRAGCSTTNPIVWIVWDSIEGKTGAVCTATTTSYPPVGQNLNLQ